MDNIGNIDGNFGVVITDVLNELQKTAVNTLLEKGKTDSEIEAYLESDEYGTIYMESQHMIINGFSESLLSHINDDAEYEKNEQELFSQHLHSIWGLGIAWMKQYRRKCFDICEGWGWYINQSPVISDKCNVFNALSAIHGKAMLVYAEIICLLENGFPDGAYAHYRMLYELWAVAEFLCEDTDDVAIAYIQSIDNKSDNEAGHYRWAKTSKRFSDKDEDVTIFSIVSEAHKTFKSSIKENVSNNRLKKLYTFPNKIIHPSAEGVFRRTSRSVENGITIGSADNGLATPAINSTMTMFNITQMFLSMVVNPVSAIGINILNDIVGKRIIPCFEDVEKSMDEGQKN